MMGEIRIVDEGYKTTELGNIPIDWDIVELNQVANRITRKNKGTISENVLTISAQYGLVSQTEFFNKKIASKNLEGYYLLKRNNFAYNKSYSKGYPMGAIKPLELYDKGVVSSLYICFEFDENLINVEFIKHYFETNLWHEEVAKIAQEGARNHGLLNISVKEFFNIKLIFPPLKEQQKIADILSTIDKQIENTDQLIIKTQEIKKGLMQKLLIKGIGHTKFKKTEVGEIPEEWQVVRLENIIESLDAGVSVNSVDISASPSEYGVLKTSSLSAGHFLSNENKTIIDSDINRAKVSPKKNSVLISRMNTPQLVGEVAYINKDYPNLFLPDRIWQTNFKYETSAKWLAELLTLQKFGSKIKIQATGTSNSMKNISKETFLSLVVPLPSFGEQQKIAEILSSVDEQIESYKKEKEKYMELKKGLMQQLLTGKLRVTV